MICKNCKTIFPDGAKCPHCGAPPLLSGGMPAPNQPHHPHIDTKNQLLKNLTIVKPEQKRSSSAVTLLTVLILLSCIAGAAYVIVPYFKKENAETGLTEMNLSAVTSRQEDTASAILRQTHEAASQHRNAPEPHPAPLRTEKAEPQPNASHQPMQKLSPMEEYIEKGFQQKEGSHFGVKFEGGENADIGHLISIILEEAYIKVGSDVGYYPEDRIEAVLYTQQQFTDVTRAPSWAGAIYDGRIKIPIGGITSRTTLLERVLFHEYAHTLVHRLAKGRAPIWLNEGIAQYVEGTVNENINEVLSFVAKSPKPLSLRPFEGSFMGYNNIQASVAYSVSLSATTYIINEFGISSVKRILENLGQGKTIEEAVSSSLYISYEDLQSNWFMSLKRKFAG